jgi:hypothetical protein
MKLVQLDDNAPANLKQLILKFSDFSTFSPEQMTAEQCFQFMKELYEVLVMS